MLNVKNILFDVTSINKNTLKHHICVDREKKEEEERKRLGIQKEEEVDEDDDIVGGSDPFKRLDSEEIKRKVC